MGRGGALGLMAGLGLAGLLFAGQATAGCSPDMVAPPR